MGDGAAPTFAELLRRHRAAAGLTQEALAERAGLSPEGVGALERGVRRAPQRQTVALLADALGLSGAARAGLEAAVERRRGPAPPRPDARHPSRAPDARPHNLPAPLTSFVGRGRELAEVRRLLGAHRLVTLTGAGGVGKTRLALQAAAGVLAGGAPGSSAARGPHPGGVWFVDLAPLAPLADPGLVADAALTALGAGGAPGQPAPAALTAVLGERRALLLLDNCEHVVEACARLVAAVLQRCPEVRLLATSREPLGVPGEAAWRVPPLTLPEPPGLLGPDGAPAPAARGLRSSEAVGLFAERAAAVDPAFRVTDQNAAHVAQVCRRLDGIPLALELAAARVRVLSVEQLAARLDDRFRLLTGGGRTALPRHQTLRALVDWSHDLLSAAERALFRRLAVFAGGFPLDGAEAVCAGGPVAAAEVLDLVTGLVDKSLVVAEPGGAARRYRLLETLRQYAADELLRAGEDGALRERHLDWCVALAHAASEARRARDVARLHEAHRRYNAEGDNVRAALTWGASRRDGAARALDLLARAALWPHPSQAETVRRLEALLAAAPARTEGRARALLQLEQLRRMQHDFAGARAAVDEARAIAGELGDEDLVTEASYHGAVVAANLGEYASAVAALERGLARARGRGDWAWVEAFARDLGVVALAMGDLPRARAALSECRDVGLRHGDARWTLRPRLFLAVVDRLAGDLPGARAVLASLCAEAGPWDAGRSLGGRFNFHEPARWARANLARDEGRLAEARRLLRRSLEDLRRRGEVDQLPAPLGMAGLLAIAAGAAARGVALLAACAPPAGPIGTVHVPELRLEAPGFLARARATLGAAGYAAAWARGRRLILQEAVALALAETLAPRRAHGDAVPAHVAGGARSTGPAGPQAQIEETGAAAPVPKEASAGAPGGATLTPRECEVAVLVARGRSNRQVAAGLGISERTAENHVKHILTKLGARSRAQIAAWATEHRLTLPPRAPPARPRPAESAAAKAARAAGDRAPGGPGAPPRVPAGQWIR
jgi:non-specific serine/threonine protein kinase